MYKPAPLFRLSFWLGAISLALCSLSMSALAGPTSLQATFTSGISNGWVKVERWRDTSGNIGQEAFPSDGRGDQSGQRATFFADSSPSSDNFLLYYAPNWNTNSKAVPVLLIHGANQDADLAWANPNDAGDYGCGQQSCPSTGLMQALVADNFKVFALSLAHKNGDGYIWAEQIANAISIIKSQTGASKVDLVTWSKSAFNARMYISSVTQSWGTSYQGDVRRLIMLGGPNNGIDWSFRHGWTHTFAVYPGCGGVINGPTAHDAILCYGIWQSGSQWSYASSYFPGSVQMLKRWDSTYALPVSEQDWYTTYEGGWGFYTHGQGIDAFLPYSLVDDVRAAGTDPAVRVHNLCGNKADIALIHNEHTGPSDGVVFVSSCNDASGLGNHGGSATINVNHLKLGWSSSGINQIKTWLNAL
ncbi:esterase/lipase family protein [Bowmanella yangjiangensis]|uniref:esterase/lipase family protein n=1 Tax=Bowmanella yangjiangensis TaxID=2811230 RepID=UPI001E4E73AD|nr:lipase [Bowmanella yangjiangensis]